MDEDFREELMEMEKPRDRLYRYVVELGSPIEAELIVMDILEILEMENN